jgi:formylmethanofuran dehydrogenase subunit B
MSQSSINGQAAPLGAALAEAARLINRSRLTVVAGLGVDVAGARAAIGLCDRIGGVVDHMHSIGLLRDLDVMREFGLMLTTPSEARIRGDVVLLVGGGLSEAGLLDLWPDLCTRTLAPPARVGAARQIIRLGPDEVGLQALTRAAGDKSANIQTIFADHASLPEQLAALRARVNGRPVALTASRLTEIDATAAVLQSSTYGVAVWSAADLDALSIEMLCGLMKDLNAKTRFTGLPLAPGDNAAAVQQVCAWMTGLPVRTGFARGFPEHDPWMFDAERLVESGEADCVIWISAYRAVTPRWRKPFALIALTDASAEFTQIPAVQIEVGRPGVDHDSVDYCAPMATLASKPATRPSDKPSAADVIGMLAVALDEEAGGAASC